MALSAGTRLGAYEVIGPLGAGGMGEVYRAKDTRLGRDVAIKMLPADVAAHPDRLARFEREARTVAGLNHPNIVMLHSVEDADGTRFLTAASGRAKAEVAKAAKSRTSNPHAYALYVQAVQLALRKTPEAFRKSDALYEEALKIDPSYAPAWDGWARNIINQMSLVLLPAREGMTRAREALERALASDPEYAPAHARLGTLSLAENDLAAAARHFERALALDPGNPSVLVNTAMLLKDLGRLDDAIAIDEAVVRDDPLDLATHTNLGIMHALAGHLDEAIACVNTVLSLNPDRGGNHSMICDILLRKGDAAGALAELEREPIEICRLTGLPMVYFALGRTADADEALDVLITKYERDAAYNIACVHAYRGDADKAFEWLERAVQYGDGALGQVAIEPLFSSIHSDPRWLPFLRKVGKAPEQIARIEFRVTLPDLAP